MLSFNEKGGLVHLIHKFMEYARAETNFGAHHFIKTR